ncbi:MAG: SRPBCC family protein [Acidimicrobiia bacterium]|nr:SRPBCC family protein [Acidimicrobiia bacterium]
MRVFVTTDVNAPGEKAFAYLADVANNPEWQSGVKSTVWTSDPPREAGSTYDQTMDYRNQVTSYRVTSLEPGRSITVESTAGAKIPTTVTRSVESLGATSCRVSVEIVGELSGWRRVAQRNLGKMIRRSTEVDYTVLKRKLERVDPGGD